MDEGRFVRGETVFNLVVDLSSEEREAVLAEECRGNPDLLHHVQRLLTAHDSGREIPRPWPEPPARWPVPPLMPQQRLGPFRIVRTLGVGGMGVVYEAEQESPQRRVALKVVRPDLVADPDAERLFRREIQTLARLKHPGIASLLESGTSPAGECYFAMELVEGVGLSDWLAARATSPWDSHAELNRRLSVFLAICDAVNYAHQRGVIHRDLKPGNVLVPGAESGEARPDRVKILDFGLARISAPEARATTTRDAGSIRGTLPYMRPEQLRGWTDSIDVRTDVYALGVMLYEMTVGHVPYELPDDLIQAISVISVAEPRPTAWAQSRRFPDDLRTIIGKAMAKDPPRRYPGVFALADDVRRYQENQPISAHPPSTIYQIRKLIHRHRLETAFAGAILSLLLTFVLVVGTQSRRIAAEAARAETEASTATEVTSFLESIFARADPREAQRSDMTAVEILDRAASRLDSQATNPAIQSRLKASLGRVYYNLGVYDRAGDLLESSLATARREPAATPLETAQILESLGLVERDRADAAAAERHLKEALELRRKALGDEDLLVAQSYHQLGTLYLSMSRGDGVPERLRQAAQALEKALTIREKRLGPNNLETSKTIGNLATVYKGLGDLKRARGYYERSLRAKEATVGPDHLDTASTLSNCGDLLVKMGRFEEAEGLLRRACDIKRRSLEDGHPSLVSSVSALGICYQRMGRYRDAEEQYRTAVLITEAKAPNSPKLPYFLNNLALLFQEEKRPEEAMAYWQKAIQEAERIDGARSALVGEFLANRADHEFAAGMRQEGLGDYLRLLDIYAASGGSPTPGAANLALDRAVNLLKGAGRVRDAEALRRQYSKLVGEGVPAPLKHVTRSPDSRDADPLRARQSKEGSDLRR